MMSSRMHKTAKGRNIEKTLTMLTSRREAPKIEFVMLLTLYVVTSYFVRILARSETVIMFGGNPLPLTVFAGVLSSLANICIIFFGGFLRQKRLLYGARRPPGSVSFSRGGHFCPA